jgi:hypothetical protein
VFATRIFDERQIANALTDGPRANPENFESSDFPGGLRAHTIGVQLIDH